MLRWAARGLRATAFEPAGCGEECGVECDLAGVAQRRAVRRFHERVDRLTQRERDVFFRMLEGKPNKIIASEFNISPRTIEIHRARVFQKLEDDNVPSSLRAATIANLVSADECPT
mgnify:CR=1 FL=1